MAIRVSTAILALVLAGCGLAQIQNQPLGCLGDDCATCGDGICDTDEDCSTCAADCGACPASCGDGTCDTDEDCTNCPADCGACAPTCGDATCDTDESCTSCPADCGACPACTLTADHTVTSGWANVTLSEPAHGEVTLELSARPNGTAMDALFGVSTGAADDYSDLPVAVRFAPEGVIDARDGSTYTADNPTPYLAGAWYDLTVRIRVHEGTYDVMAGPCDGVKAPVITGAAFRSDAPGSQAPDNLAIWSSGDATLEVTAVTWTPGACTAMTCTDLGAECGDLDDGCGGTVSCGTCSSGVCDGGSCCVPATCADLTAECGSHGDGCGGTLDCGGCTESTCVSGTCTDVTSDRPWEHNTGPTDEGALVSSSSFTASTAGAVYENLDISGTITIAADNVTIRNFRINGGIYGIKVNSGLSGILIEDGEIYGMSSAAILGVGFTARRLYIHDSSGDGIKAQGSGGPTLVEYCFIEKLGKGDGAHADGNQTRGGSNITFRYNNIYMPNPGTPTYPGAPYKSNATFMLQLTISNFVIENNWLTGGNYCIYSPGGVSVRNNIFGRHNAGWPDDKEDLRIKNGTFDEWSGNVWEDTGEPI